MAANSAEFLISIEQRLKGDDAASELEKAEKGVVDAIASYKQLEAATAKTEAAFAKVGVAIDKTRASMQKAMDSGNAAAFWKQAAALQKLEVQERSLKTAVDAARKSQQAQAKAATDAAAKLERVRAAESKGGLAAKLAATEVFDLESAFGDLGGPIGNAMKRTFELGEAFKKLAAQGGGMGLAIGGSVLMVSVLSAVAVALATAGVSAGVAAVKMADTARNQRLTMEAMLGSRDAAVSMGKAFRDVQRTVGGTTERLTEITKQLKDANVSGKDMRVALKAIATQEAAIGSDKTGELIAELKAGKKSAAEMATVIEKRYGGVARAKMIGLDQTATRLKENMGGMFAGLKIDGVLKRFAKVADMFDESTTSGKRMQRIFGLLFQPLVAAAEMAIPYMVLGVLELAIVFVKLANMIKPAYRWVMKFLGIKSAGSAIETAMHGAIAVVVAFAAVLAAPIAVVALLSVAIKGLWLGAVIAFEGIVAAVKWLGTQISAAASGVSSWASSMYNAVALWFSAAGAAVAGAWKSISSLDFAQLGKDLIDGFVKGIKAGAAAVTDAVTGMGEGAYDGLAKAIGAKSPARKFIQLGGYSAEGYAIGVDDGADDVERSVSRMLSGGSEKPSTGSANSITYGDTHIHVDGRDVDDERLAELIRDGIVDYFRQTALEMGAEPRTV